MQAYRATFLQSYTATWLPRNASSNLPTKLPVKQRGARNGTPKDSELLLLFSLVQSTGFFLPFFLKSFFLLFFLFLLTQP